jgi:hypothetical protein
MEVLANSSLKEKKLKPYLTSMHTNLVAKPPSYWRDKEEGARRMKLDAPSLTLCRKRH